MNLPTNTSPMRDKNIIAFGDRIFYEIGYKRNPNGSHYAPNWIRTGEFKEIVDVASFLRLDDRLSDSEYLEHHNFMILKSNENSN